MLWCLWFVAMCRVATLHIYYAALCPKLPTCNQSTSCCPLYFLFSVEYMAYPMFSYPLGLSPQTPGSYNYKAAWDKLYWSLQWCTSPFLFYFILFYFFPLSWGKYFLTCEHLYLLRGWPLHIMVFYLFIYFNFVQNVSFLADDDCWYCYYCYYHINNNYY